MVSGENPFGDGRAAERIADIVETMLADDVALRAARRETVRAGAEGAMELLRGMLAVAG
jgi:hypothetical protein